MKLFVDLQLIDFIVFEFVYTGYLIISQLWQLHFLFLTNTPHSKQKLFIK